MSQLLPSEREKEKKQEKGEGWRERKIEILF